MGKEKQMGKNRNQSLNISKLYSQVEKDIVIGQFYKRSIFDMNFSEIPENPFIFLSWVTAIGLFISISEATIKIKLEKRNNYRKRLELINNLYPKKLA